LSARKREETALPKTKNLAQCRWGSATGSVISTGMPRVAKRAPQRVCQPCRNIGVHEGLTIREANRTQGKFRCCRLIQKHRHFGGADIGKRINARPSSFVVMHGWWNFRASIGFAFTQ
jgi:hypothetical protein